MIAAMIKRGFLIILLFVVACPLSATTYFVANAGSDSNNGTAAATPWQTIAHVNAQRFNPGDSVLFNRGDTWREQLRIPSSGSNGNPITFGAYGTGALPIISGANLEKGWVTEVVGSFTAYYVATSTQPKQVFENGTRYTSVSAKASLTPGSFWWDSADGRVYVRTSGDNSPGGYTIEASQRDYAVYAFLKSYVTLSNLQTQEANVNGVYMFGTGATGLLVTDLLSQNNFTYGIRLEQASNSTVRATTIAYNGAGGVSVVDTPTMLFDKLTAHHNSLLTDTDTTAGIKADGINTTNLTIQYCVSYFNGLGVGSTGARGAGIWADTIGTGLTVQYNLTYSNNFSGISAEADSSVKILYNISYSNGWTGIGNNSGGGHIANNLIYGNVSYGNVNAGFSIYGDGSSGGCANNTVSNNLFLNNTVRDLQANTGCNNDGVLGSGNVYTYNGFGTQRANFIEWGSGNFLSTYAAFDTAYGSATHSLTSDPAFTNAGAGNFTLSSGSPAIDAGLNPGSIYQNALLPTSSWPGSVATDNQNSYGAGWEIGAFVFNPSRPAPPADVTIQVQ